ncbi:MAG: DUF2807 domain-containing protein [Defluviitaleaceae bacterium]|nr:DUF2807 domain-containing protein [Defluviitaleaceae bacterium]
MKFFALLIIALLAVSGCQNFGVENEVIVAERDIDEVDEVIEVVGMPAIPHTNMPTPTPSPAVPTESPTPQPSVDTVYGVSRNGFEYTLIANRMRYPLPVVMPTVSIGTVSVGTTNVVMNMNIQDNHLLFDDVLAFLESLPEGYMWQIYGSNGNLDDYIQLTLDEDDIIQGEISLPSFSGISSVFPIILTSGNGYGVSYQINPQIEEFMEIFLEDDVLNIRMKSEDNIVMNRNLRDLATVYVHMDNLENVRLLDITHLTGDIYGDNVNITAHHASSVNANINANILTLNFSDASTISGEINANSLNANFSGASVVNVSGRTEELNIRGSGASVYMLEDFTTQRADIRLSGASWMTIHVTEHLDINLSGTSTALYHGNPTVNQGISGLSTLTRAD